MGSDVGHGILLLECVTYYHSAASRAVVVRTQPCIEAAEGGRDLHEPNPQFLWDIAPILNAAILVVEQRYIGQSLPFGEESFKNSSMLSSLTIDNILYDNERVLDYFHKHNLNNVTIGAIVSVGVGYAGLIASWRLSNEQWSTVTQGKWISSSPLYNFGIGGVPVGAFDYALTESLAKHCDRDKLTRLIRLIDYMSNTTEGCEELASTFKLDPGTNLNREYEMRMFKQFVYDGLLGLVTNNYPYPTSFTGQSLPSWPLQQACKVFNSGREELQELYEIVNSYYNASGTLTFHCITPEKCGLQIKFKLNQQLVINYQLCTQFRQLRCHQGHDNDIFWPECNQDNIEHVIGKYCETTFKDSANSKSEFHVTADTYAQDVLRGQNMIFTYELIYFFLWQKFYDMEPSGTYWWNENESLKTGI
ncbi:serine carboxypeptidase s28 domain-containing protein [Ditylenchus destructor]|uniref:Serine carboxypeptidase s28 domain-containing protein n=1 Tax=Ditylenchus destructor TaxID=166010 RepID=A0AAD4MJ24_9BILA|nr:serine carboxypeptidase s28 domain-containing protein [Ditylenchus destructor]